MASPDPSHVREQLVVFSCGDVARVDRHHLETASLSTLFHFPFPLAVLPWDFAPQQRQCEQVSFASSSVL